MSKFKLQALSEPMTNKTGLEHAILQSLFNYEKAGSNDHLDPNQDFQGWWGSTFVNAVGCKEWTLKRAKQTTDTRNRAIKYTEQSLSWLIEKNIALKIDVSAIFEKEKLIRTIDITLLDNIKFQVSA